MGPSFCFLRQNVAKISTYPIIFLQGIRRKGSRNPKVLDEKLKSSELFNIVKVDVSMGYLERFKKTERSN